MDVGLAAKMGEKTSNSNFKVCFSERPRDVVRGFLFEFGVTWENGYQG